MTRAELWTLFIMLLNCTDMLLNVSCILYIIAYWFVIFSTLICIYNCHRKNKVFRLCLQLILRKNISAEEKIFAVFYIKIIYFFFLTWALLLKYMYIHKLLNYIIQPLKLKINKTRDIFNCLWVNFTPSNKKTSNYKKYIFTKK